MRVKKINGFLTNGTILSEKAEAYFFFSVIKLLKGLNKLIREES